MRSRRLLRPSVFGGGPPNSRVVRDLGPLALTESEPARAYAEHSREELRALVLRDVEVLFVASDRRRGDSESVRDVVLLQAGGIASYSQPEAERG